MRLQSQDLALEGFVTFETTIFETPQPQRSWRLSLSLKLPCHCKITSWCDPSSAAPHPPNQHVWAFYSHDATEPLRWHSKISCHIPNFGSANFWLNLYHRKPSIQGIGTWSSSWQEHCRRLLTFTTRRMCEFDTVIASMTLFPWQRDVYGASSVSWNGYKRVRTTHFICFWAVSIHSSEFFLLTVSCLFTIFAQTTLSLPYFIIIIKVASPQSLLEPHCRSLISSSS